MYINIETKKYPITFEEIKENFLNISFSDTIDNEFLKTLGYYLVSDVKRPEVNRDTHKMVEITPIEKDGEYYRNFEIVELTDKEKDLVKQSNIEHKNAGAHNIRKERDRLIAETDYIMMEDYPVNKENREEWKEYRQKLRNIPELIGFPWNCVVKDVKWPEKPELEPYIPPIVEIEQTYPLEIPSNTSTETEENDTNKK